MRNIRLTIAYDGTDFCGWQRQDNDRTVQGVIEQALEKMHGSQVNMSGSGRTDSGVHAAGQAANFLTEIDSIPEDRFAPALNTLLPHDVRILDSREEDSNFHARFSAVSRTYRYYFILGAVLPHERLYNQRLFRLPCLKTLNAYGRLLLGETDCSIFSAASDTSSSKHRYIYRSSFFIEGNRLIFEICANAFLRKMVRSVAGTFLHYEEKHTPQKKLQEIINTANRSLAGPTLPPHGLFLWKVEY
ncbi:MAG: tRNA pseudouridine(38-40) synthase TruA [Treponema sp.]|nr:tRNA pseudouridine(38-40) synthase TruA [Treponema sp.]